MLKVKPLHRKSLFLFSYCRSRSQASAFQARELSYSSQNWRRTQEELRNARVSVWWDFENCNVPVGAEALKVAPAIIEAVRANGIKGPLQITAFGDVLQLSRANQEAFSCTGIHLNHIPNDGKNSADKFFDLMYWVSQNPPPAHLFLISGDRNLAGLLHRLKMDNYNILLAVPERRAPDVLCSAANITWQWSSLLKGEDLTVKQINNPPDGAVDSLHGSDKRLLGNSLLAVEQSTSLQKVETPERCSDCKVGEVPMSVVREVKDILSSHPKGISITGLCEELRKRDVHLNKKLYGYRKFSHFLLSMPHVHLQSLGEGNFCVHLIPSKSRESFEGSVVSSIASAVNEERGHAATPMLNGLEKNMDGDADDTSPVFSLNRGIMDGDSRSSQQVTSQGKLAEQCVDGKPSFPSVVINRLPNELRKSSTGSEEVLNAANAQLVETQLPAKDDEVSKFGTDSLKMRSKKSSDNDIAKSEDASEKIPEKHTTSGNHSAGNVHTTVEINGTTNYKSGFVEAKNKYENPTRKEIDEVCGSPYTPPVDDSLVDKRPGGSADTYGKSPTFFSWIRSWWPLWKGRSKSDDSTAQQNKVVTHFEDPKLSEIDQTVSHLEDPKLSEVDQNVSHSGKSKLFSSRFFWIEMESFVFSPKGLLLFIHSRSREDIARKLQEDRPPVLSSLTEKDILQLVDLLIVEKKWLEETPSQDFAFRLTQPVQKSSLTGKSHGANGLRSLFLDRTSQSNLQKSVEHDADKHNQSISHSRVSAPAKEMKSSVRSKNDMLLDCQKLVREILGKHPKGYLMSSFRQHFHDRYGYHLDLRKLGYPKLASLLQTMPGVKIESNFMLRTNASNAVSSLDGELSDLSPKDDSVESQWEELGPVSVDKYNQSDLESKLRQKAKELDTPKHPYYEPIESDYDSSEPEEDSAYLTHLRVEGNPKHNEQDSPFWQTLDLWHSGKEGGSSAKKSKDVDVLGNSVVDLLNSATDSTRVIPSKIPSGNHGQKRRSPKNYSFVDETSLSNNNNLIGGLIDSSKKDESKMQN